MQLVRKIASIMMSEEIEDIILNLLNPLSDGLHLWTINHAIGEEDGLYNGRVMKLRT